MRRLVFSVVSFFALLAAVYFSFGNLLSFYFPSIPPSGSEPNNAMAGIWLAFSLFVFALGWPEVAESITFFGNSVKTREVKEAAIELKAIATSLAQVLLEGTQAAGRWGGGFGWERKQQLREEIEQSLLKSGYTPEEILHVFAGWNRWALYDYASVISTIARNNHKDVPTKWTEEHSNRYQEINKAESPAASSVVKSFMEENGFLDAELEKYIGKMEFYEKHGRHENPTEWPKIIERARRK